MVEMVGVDFAEVCSASASGHRVQLFVSSAQNTGLQLSVHVCNKNKMICFNLTLAH